jgi:hypothetical protein
MSSRKFAVGIWCWCLMVGMVRRWRLLVMTCTT